MGDATSNANTSPTSSSGTGHTETSSSPSTTSTGITCNACAIDFPCNGSEDQCADPQTIQRYQTIDCVEAIERGLTEGDCDPECCFGSSCAPGPIEACDPETSCVMTTRGPQCRRNEEVCNATDLPCGEMQFCEFAPGLCPDRDDDLGYCVDVGDPCPEPKLDEPECGCDGVLYPSACERRNAGVALDDPFGCQKV